MCISMWILLALFAMDVVANDNLRVAYQWKQIDFEYPNIGERQAAITNSTFISENVVPVGLEVYKNRLFITLPRWKKGVPASLAYIDLNDNFTQSPALKPYPSWSAHRVTNDEVPEIISPFRVRADNCGRLWVLDTGVENIANEANATVLSPTRLLIYDLHNDNLLRSYKFPDDHIKDSSFFVSIAVEDENCDDSYAYSADLGKPGLVIYSWKSQSSWRMTHNFFHPDPTAGNFSINNITFQWEDGLFGLALSKPQPPDNHPTLYFHPFVSMDEFQVSTKFLKNETLATSNEIYKEFKRIGSRGPNGQSSVEFLDKKTGVLFYTLPNLNAIACWKTSNKEYTLKSQGRIFMDPVLMEFPNDVKVDDQSRLWVLSDRLQKFLYSELDSNEINFRILTATVQDAISHTACDPKTKRLPDIINKLSDLIKTTAKPSTKSNAEKFYASGLIVLSSILMRTVF
ncbi:CLUMA_CG006902, isoform A [Clunio marinus]|uniref:CLUMA_CG006902, isoform A n=1 Tax=Clunio marinus TaxID=568069 RepID=A0A1J1I4Q0_9DIPT|nr:CLUMA_CG006902, isoform A [Clunio marinus]